MSSIADKKDQTSLSKTVEAMEKASEKAMLDSLPPTYSSNYLLRWYDSCNNPKPRNGLHRKKLKFQKRAMRLPESSPVNHTFMSKDYLDFPFPLPTMFGNEETAYHVVDITDTRYVVEGAERSRNLHHLSYDLSIINTSYQCIFRQLQQAEFERDTLPKKKPDPNVVKAANEKVAEHLKALKQFQLLKDQHEQRILAHMAWCAALKKSIAQETRLEENRRDMTRATQMRLAQDGKSLENVTFNVKPQNKREASDE